MKFEIKTRFGLRTQTLEDLQQILDPKGNAKTLSLKQIHSSQFHLAKDILNSSPPGDALILKSSHCPPEGILLGVQTADCVPLLLQGQSSDGQQLVAAIHSGWRGTVGGILQETLGWIQKEGEWDLKEIEACLGPSIETGCYEVDEPVQKLVVQAGLEEFLHPRETPGRWFFDNAGAVVQLLTQEGLLPERIQAKGGCTFCQPEDYASYRREGVKRGRQWSLVGLLPK